jgi:hypothetical protein
MIQNNYYGSKVIQQRKKRKGTNGDMKKEGMGWKEENVKGWNIWMNDKSLQNLSIVNSAMLFPLFKLFANVVDSVLVIVKGQKI